MKVIPILVCILVLWGGYDYLKIFFIKKRYSADNIKIKFTASKGRHIGNFIGLSFGIAGIIFGIVTSQESLLLLGGVCFCASFSDFSRSYIGVTEKGIVMNGRLIGLAEVSEYGSVHGLVVLNFVNILEVCTSEYREYVYVKKGYDIRNITKCI